MTKRTNLIFLRDTVGYLERGHLADSQLFRYYESYDDQLGKALRKLDDQVSTFNLYCCHGQLVPIPVATCRLLTSLAVLQSARN